MESPLHLDLKGRALRFLAERGCAVAGTEVTAPIARFRVDAAGYRYAGGVSDRTAAEHSGSLWPDLWPETFLIECKASRADFLRCTSFASALRQRRDRLRKRRTQQADDFAKADDAPADLGDRLFPESTGPTHARKVIDYQLRRVQRDLYAAAKFDLFHRYQLGTFLLLVTGPGVLSADELPMGWGWLEVSDREDLRVEPPRHEAPTRWLGRLARSAARSASAATRTNLDTTPGPSC